MEDKKKENVSTCGEGELTCESKALKIPTGRSVRRQENQ